MAALIDVPVNAAERDLKPWRPCLLCGEHLKEQWHIGETWWSHPYNGCLLFNVVVKRGHTAFHWNHQMSALAAPTPLPNADGKEPK